MSMDNKQDFLTAEFLKQRYMLMAFIRGMLRDEDTAEDIFQEVWLQLAAAYEKGTEVKDLAKWSRGVARNLMLKHWRKTRTSKVTADSEMLDLVAVSFEEQDGNKEYWDVRRKAMRGCIEDLPEKSRKLLNLRYDKNNPIAKVAEKLDKTASSIMMTLSRLRKSIGQCAKRKIEEAS
jgi:RNA polymerase sigma-70 factor (ECF subfamily)